ncbi:protein kinase [Streptomyces sp. NBRC 109706]|uniref:protein kinase n=1 Tax=Streptomyces sp. NBRC 109706 TaxID=1550035 RepID=UPI001F1B8601|nr:protein kinase [Streptomyces sp. NBRC 109706]
MRKRSDGWHEQLLREKVINPFVRTLAPELLWTAEDSEWVALGFESVEGRRTDFRLGSGDLSTVVELVNRIGELPLPEVARDWRETRWDWWADRGAPELFVGDTLLHADINPSNLLIGPDRCWVVDWAWPTRGAAFIDPAMMVLQFIGARHPPAVAESWAKGCPAWTEADPEAIDAFVVAYARLNRDRALRRPEEPWLEAMAVAAESWAAHRGLTIHYY